MPLKPLNDRVLVKRLEGEQMTKGGIIIPDSAKEKPAEGNVIAIGAGVKDADGKPMELAVKVGDRVLFGKYSGTEVRVDGEDHIILNESDILAVIER